MTANLKIFVFFLVPSGAAALGPPLWRFEMEIYTWIVTYIQDGKEYPTTGGPSPTEDKATREAEAAIDEVTRADGTIKSADLLTHAPSTEPKLLKRMSPPQ